MNTPPTPARQAAERIAVRPELQSRHLPCNAREEIIFNIIKQEFATERQQVREAIKGVLGWYAVWQRDPDKSPHTANVFFAQLRDVLEKL